MLRVRALKILGWGYSLTENRAKGEAALANAITLAEELRLPDGSDQEVIAELASCHNLLANLLQESSSTSEAEPHYRDAIRLCRELVNDERRLPALGECLIDQANNFRDQGRVSEARQCVLGSPRRLQGTVNEGHPECPPTYAVRRLRMPTLVTSMCRTTGGCSSASEKKTKAELARNNFKAAIVLFDHLKPGPESMPGHAFEEAFCYQNLGRFERRLRNFEAALIAAAPRRGPIEIDREISSWRRAKPFCSGAGLRRPGADE